MNQSKFKGSISSMLEASRTIQNSFINHVADFSAFDPQLNTAFGTLWKQKTDAAASVPQDIQLLGRQRSITDDLKKSLQNGIDAYETLAYFIRRIFPNRTDMLAEFGDKQLSKARKSQAEMIRFLENTVQALSKYSKELGDAGCRKEVLDAPGLALADLKDKNNQQEAMKRSRREETSKRNAQMQEVYEFMGRVSEAAMHVYAKDPVLAAMFVYRPVTHARKNVKENPVNTGTTAPVVQ